MFVLGLQGSPRRKSNTDFLLATFMAAAEKRGAETHTVEVCRRHIEPCKELIVCEKRGYCPIDDDMKHDIYPLLRRADVVVAASPIFFYNITAQLKALIDRCQTLWARKYRFHLKDPGSGMRKGVLLSVGATRGKNLFEGVELTVKYFFDAIDAGYAGSLTYHQIEHRGDMEKHPTVLQDVEDTAAAVCKPFMGRRKVLFASRDNACRSQMAHAFARLSGGERIDAMCGGVQPAESVDPVMAEAMAEAGIDMAFHRPRLLKNVLDAGRPDLIVTLDAGLTMAADPDIPIATWSLPGVGNGKIEDMRRLRDAIKARVTELINR